MAFSEGLDDDFQTAYLYLWHREFGLYNVWILSIGTSQSELFCGTHGNYNSELVREQGGRNVGARPRPRKIFHFLLYGEPFYYFFLLLGGGSFSPRGGLFATFCSLMGGGRSSPCMGPFLLTRDFWEFAPPPPLRKFLLVRLAPDRSY